MSVSDLAALVLGASAAIVALLCAVGALRAPTAADALHFTAPVAVVGTPLLAAGVSIGADSVSHVVQIWIAAATVVLTTAPSTHALARMLRRREQDRR